MHRCAHQNAVRRPGGKHPTGAWGTWAVSVTPQQIDIAWNKYNGLANIGIACGPSGIVVLDEDQAAELDKWCAAYGVTLPPTYEVTTGRGRHLYLLLGSQHAADRQRLKSVRRIQD